MGTTSTTATTDDHVLDPDVLIIRGDCEHYRYDLILHGACGHGRNG